MRHTLKINVSIGIVILLVCGAFTLPGMTMMDPADQKDQEQPVFNGGLACIYEDVFVQGFVPTLDILTRVELLMTRNTTVVPGLQIAIRDQYDGGDLATAEIEEDVPSGTYTWISFDFEDIRVVPGRTYYIVWNGWHGGDYGKNYYWGYGSNNPYGAAASYYYDDSDNEWEGPGSIDFCFITYGKENHPPETPEQPNGQTYLQPGVSYSYTTKTSDPESDKVRYGWDLYGDNTVDEWTPLYDSGREITYPLTFYSPGEYDLKVKAEDSYGKKSGWSDPLQVTVVDKAPTPPNITGPTQGTPGNTYNYSITSSDPNREPIKYRIKWGDDTQEETEYLPSGESIILPHTWDNRGTYRIQAQAVDDDLESEWSTLTVTMPKTFPDGHTCWLQHLHNWILNIIEKMMLS